jgi:S1-C subfamily serine protease
LKEPEGVIVERVIENSPGDAAGLESGDLLYEVVQAGETRARKSSSSKTSSRREWPAWSPE